MYLLYFNICQLFIFIYPTAFSIIYHWLLITIFTCLINFYDSMSYLLNVRCHEQYGFCAIQIKHYYYHYPLEERYLAAGLFLAMLPAGMMWSVVTESPRCSNTWASVMWPTGGRSLVWTTTKQPVGLSNVTDWGRSLVWTTTKQGTHWQSETKCTFSRTNWRQPYCYT